MNTLTDQASAPLALAQGASADTITRTSSLDGLVRSLDHARELTGAAVHELAESAGKTAQEGLDAVRRCFSSHWPAARSQPASRAWL